VALAFNESIFVVFIVGHARILPSNSIGEAFEPLGTTIGGESLSEAIGNWGLPSRFIESLLGRVMTRTEKGDAITICVQTSVLSQDSVILLCPIYPRANFSMRGVRLWIDRFSTKDTCGGK
jgi:hypothetical protein